MHRVDGLATGERSAGILEKRLTVVDRATERGELGADEIEIELHALTVTASVSCRSRDQLRLLEADLFTRTSIERHDGIMSSDPSTTSELITPALLVDVATFNRNLAAMDAVLPGARLRPHVKAFKSTDMAKRLDADGHHSFCAATPREIEGLVAAGLTADLLLANETLDAARLGALADRANITVAIDSNETLDAAVAGGVRSVLVDVDVGLPAAAAMSWTRVVSPIAPPRPVSRSAA